MESTQNTALLLYHCYFFPLRWVSNFPTQQNHQILLKESSLGPWVPPLNVLVWKLHDGAKVSEFLPSAAPTLLHEILLGALSQD